VFTIFSINFDNRLVKRRIEYHSDTKISVFSELKEKQISGVLRSTPVVNDNLYQDPCVSQKIIGNQILEINDAKVVVLDCKKDWLLVLHNKDNEHSIIGWIKEE